MTDKMAMIRIDGDTRMKLKVIAAQRNTTICGAINMLLADAGFNAITHADNAYNDKKTLTLNLKSSNTKIRAVSKKKTKTAISYTADFSIIWARYPNGRKKHEALRAWERVKKQDGIHCGLPVPSVATILQVVEWKGRTDLWKRDDRKYVEHLVTFLNNRRWEDEPDSPIRAEPIEKFERLAKEIHAAYLKRQEPKQ